jgi:hypothetical protein
MHRFSPLICLILVSSAWAAGQAQTTQEDAKGPGVPVTYELPGKPGETYLVTLAIVEAKHPNWIVSNFVSGAPRTITVENQGRFTEKWDGLDENFMPVPAGTYGVKGIYSPAVQWPAGGAWHAITPKFIGGISAWMPTSDAPDTKLPFGGDPVGSPLADVAVGPNGVAVFYYIYLENGTNAPMIDLKKPVGYDQFIKAFGSGGAAGGGSVATDGQTVWAFENGGFVYRTDGKAFGHRGDYHRQGYMADGAVTAMAVWRDPASARSYVYVAQGGKYSQTTDKRGHVHNVASKTEFVDKITVHDGANGNVLATLTLTRPQGLAVSGSKLYALHGDGEGWAISAVDLNGGVPQNNWQRVFAVPANIKPADMEADSHGRFYLSDRPANKVYQLDASGKMIRTIGRLDQQAPGKYDPLTLMSPAKLATWRDDAGKDRLLIVEMAGPNRVSEWSTDDGSLLREFPTYQTRANDGYAVDEEHPEDLYIEGQDHWLNRFKINYATHAITIDAVWPIADDPRLAHIEKPRVVRVNGRTYLACEKSHNVYRLDGDRWVLSAGIVQDKDRKLHYWHDANGNGKVDDEELTPADFPGGASYHGQRWTTDLSYLVVSGADVKRMSPDGFDAHGNPIFTKWTTVVADPTFAARAAGKADAIHGGNEDGKPEFGSSWVQADETPGGDLYVNARSGKDFSPNEGSQFKLSRYVHNDKGKYEQKWRVGRSAITHTAHPGEAYGTIRLRRPINGLISVIDQSRCGVLLYTEDGLYVDTIFPDAKTERSFAGTVYALPGEFFAGIVYPNKDNGQIYIGMGKYTPLLFEAEGWSLNENPVHPLTTVQKTVEIDSSQIASPPEMALSLRGGAGKAQVAQFAPAVGGAALDGSMDGWDQADAVQFGPSKEQNVEARCLYDADHLYLRWHARLGGAVDLKPLPALGHIFTHEQLADTLSFYIQGDPTAPPSKSRDGRPGDVRFIFGLFKNGSTVEPVAVGFYPSWQGAGQRQTYRTLVGEVSFANVGAIPGVKLGYVIDKDNKGYVLAAAIPRSAIPAMQKPFDGKLRTLVDFEATFGGHNEFWWADSDGTASRETYDEPTEAALYPGAWAQAVFHGIEPGVPLRKWLVCGPFGGPGAEKFNWQVEDKKAALAFFGKAVYPPDEKFDPAVVYKGDLIQGWWKPERTVTWKPATIADMDTRLKLGPPAQVWFATTWIYSPADCEVNMEFQTAKFNEPRWFLNGQKLEISKYVETLPRVSTAEQRVKLKAGWNQIYVRDFCTAYDARLGIVIKDEPEKMWSLRLSGTPPQP